MKIKFLFTIISLLCSLTHLKAQVIVSESFENAFPPTGWTITTGINSNPWELSTTDPAANGIRCMKNDSYDLFGANTWIFSTPFSLTPGISYRISYWYRIVNTGSLNQKSFRVTLGKLPTINGQTNFLHTYSDITNTNYTQGIDVFTVPESGTYYFAFNCFYSSNYGRLLMDNIVLEQVSGTACSGMPPAGVVTGPSTICPDSTFTLNIAGIPDAGIGYQWQSSPAGQNSFTDITGATAENYTTTQTASKDYRCVATCFFSGQSSVSNTIAVNSPPFCYCIPTTVCTSSYITNVSFVSINNTTACSAGGYTNYSSTIAAANITGGTVVPISVTVNGGGVKRVTAWIDYNQNGVFEFAEYTQVGIGDGIAISGNITVPASALPGLTRMRVRERTTQYPSEPCFNYVTGETEDYAINISPFVCSGTPAAGTVTGISYVCSGVSFTLNLSGTYAGYALQWESSPAGANNFSAIPGANSTGLTTSQTTSNDYRVRVTCVASGLSAFSNIKAVTTPVLCYCLPFNSCSSTYISNVTFASLNNTSTCIAGGDYTATVPAGTMNAGLNNPVSVTLTGGTPGAVAVWVDLNRNGVFETTEYTNIGTGAGQVLNGSVFIPTPTPAGITRMRVKWRVGGVIAASNACSDFVPGETEDYNVNIIDAPIVTYFTTFADTLYDPVINVTARIVQKDLGINATDSLKPRLWAKRQGTSTWKSFKGQLLNGTVNDGNWIFPVNHDSLGVRRNGCDSIQFYFVSQDLNIPSNIGYLPEPGALHTNVQAQVTPPSQLFGYRLKPRLKNTIYVSNSDCRYWSLSKNNGLFQQINNRKLEGDLTVIIGSDLQEDAANELTAAGLNGYRLTIRPDGNTVRTLIQNVYKSSLIILNGVKNVTIDGSYNGTGRFLALTNASTTTQYTDSLSCIEIKNGCDSIILKNLVIRHAVYLISSPGITAPENAILIANGANRHISILNNFFTNLSANNMCSRHIASFAGNNDVLIRGNEFNNFTGAGIIMFGISDSWVVDSNHFYRTTVPNFYSSDFAAISLKGGGHFIRNNFVGGQAPFCAGSAMMFIDNPSSSVGGISVTGSGPLPVTISHNRVDNINMGLTFAARAAGFYGIGSGSSNDVFITNNIVGNPQSSVATITPLAGSISGIFAGGMGYAEIRDNIVTSLSNKAGAGPDYDHITLSALGRGNSTPFGITGYNSEGIVSGNRIYNIHNYNNAHGGNSPDEPYTRGIYCYGTLNLVIEKNMIHDIWCNENSIAGIHFNDGDSAGTVTIRQNRIYDLNNTGPFAGYITGISVRHAKNRVDVLNNQVSVNNNNLSSGVFIRGISETSRTNTRPDSRKRFTYNSVYIGGTGTAASYGYNFENANNLPETRSVFNNIFYNERTGGSTGHFAYRLYASVYEVATFLNNTVFNNNFYTLNDSLKFTEFATAPLSWTNWKSTYNFDNLGSISTPAKTPALQLFMGKAQGNLNIDSSSSISWRVNEKGKPFADIDKDFDSAAVRSTDIVNGITDIGSDEFNTSTLPGIPLCAGGNADISSNIAGSSYQWQLDTGTGYTNISDNTNYSGTNSATLQLTNIPSAWDGYKYRCVADGNYSQVYSLVFENFWTGSVNTAWENPANWSCGTVPDSNTDVIINSGTVIISSNVVIRTLRVGNGVVITIMPGYNLTITH